MLALPSLALPRGVGINSRPFLRYAPCGAGAPTTQQAKGGGADDGHARRLLSAINQAACLAHEHKVWMPKNCMVVHVC